MAKKPIINYRQKTLIGLLRVFGGRLPSRDFQKYLFLFTQEYQKEPAFEFIPYKFGCFSFQSYADKRRLIEIGALQDVNEWQLHEDFKTDQFLLDGDVFNKFYDRYACLRGDKLVQDVYRRYPYYAINSQIAERLMNNEELLAINAERPRHTKACFFTIGYEGSSVDGYLNRLINNNVRMLVDVRRNPLSRKYGFSKKVLSETVTKFGIKYVHMPELGIASEQRQELNTPADYVRLFDAYEKNELKRNGLMLEKLFTLAKRHKRVAITCYEADVCMCHRGRVAKTLSTRSDWDYDIQHI